MTNLLAKDRETIDMWCQPCQREVAVSISTIETACVCAECGNLIESGEVQQGKAEVTAPTAEALSAECLASSWKRRSAAIDSELAAAEAALLCSDALCHDSSEHELDLTALDLPLSIELPNPQPQTLPPAAESTAPWMAGLIFSFLLYLGLAGVACGLALLAWWMAAVRQDLCLPGVAALLIGQLTLVLAFAIRSFAQSRTAPAPTAPAPTAPASSVDRRTDGLHTLRPTRPGSATSLKAAWHSNRQLERLQ